jgi:subtilisin-like proprotein convertase family protein
MPSGHETSQNGIWQGFAKYGMGPNAQSNGPFLTGIVADFNTPEPTQPGSQADVQVEATPHLAIPDNQPAGVSSVLTVVAQASRITRLAVSVGTQHTFIGDLRVSLTSPTGTTVLLHDRNGGSANDLVETYTSENVAALGVLLGEDAQGDWTLQAADHAGIDVGTLEHWRLEMDLEAAGESIDGEATLAIAIPDNDPNGISSTINIAQAGTAQSVQVSIDITHTFIGHLRVELVAPSGHQVLLRDQFGGSADNLIATFDSITHPALADLVGQPILGDWELRVADLVGQDTGKLNAWRLRLTH